MKRIPISRLNLNKPSNFAASVKDEPTALDAMLDRGLADGGKLLRLWHSNFGTIDKDLATLIACAKGSGYRVILCVQPKDGGAENFGSPDIAGFVQRNATILKQCEFVEAGNELNLNQYRPDDFGGPSSWHKPYVDRWLRPLSIACRAIGVKVMATSTTDSWSAGTYAANADALVAAGAGQWCDAVATHVYWRVAAIDTLKDTLADLGRRWGKPLYVTECNLHEQTPLTDLPVQLPVYLKAIRAAGTVAGVLLYRAMPHTKATVWQGERIFGDGSGRPTSLYAVALKALAVTA